MGFYREIEVWCLHKISFPYPSYFLSHPLLIGEISHMLNDRIRKYYVKFFIFVPTKVSCVTNYRYEIRVFYFYRVNIQQSKLNISFIDKTHIFPEPLSSPYIQQLDWPWNFLYQAFEEFEPLTPKTS